MKLVSSKRRMAVIGLTVGLIAGASGLAVAFFTTSGSGNGSAQTGTGANVTITQVGAGYDSLAPSYHQDQCFNCASITQFGNAINLAPGSGQLANVVVAFRSYGATTSSEPITLTLYSPAGPPNYVGGELTPYSSVTITPTIPAGNVTRTTFNATFDFSHQDLTLSGPVVYGVSWQDLGGAVINVALSNSVSNLTVGSDQYPGYVFVNGVSNALAASNDAGSCATSTASTFMAVNINCATPPVNYGAYGPGSNPANADIPAVEFNVVGGSTPALYPGGPSQPVDFAITNAGPSPAHITTVTTSITGLSGAGGPNLNEPCTTSMYVLTTTPLTLNTDVPTGTTIFSPSGTNIHMVDDGNNQDNCEGAVVLLGFTAP